MIRIDWLKGRLEQLRVLVRKRAVERELDEEVAFHLEMETEKNIREGMRPDEARRAARLAFGGEDRFKEAVRDARWTKPLEDFATDLRYAARTLRRRPGFAAAAVLTLAIGLGALAISYGLVYGVLLRPLPYPEADRLTMVWQTLPGWERFPASYPIYDRWSRESASFEALAAYDDVGLTITGGAEPERVLAIPATANLLEVLGVAPARGRWFSAEEDRRGASVAVIGHDFWRTRLGGAPGIVGSTIRLDDRGYTIIGIMPPDFRFPSPRTALWMPLGPDARERGWNSQFLEVIGRLGPGATLAQAEAEIGSVTARAVTAGDGPEVGARVVPRHEDLVGDVRRTLLLALAAAAAVLLIGGFNVANLFLARWTAAGRELAVRSALGAGRFRLIRQMMTEGSLLGLLGAGVGLAIAGLAPGPVRAILPERLPRIAGLEIDAPIVLFVLAVAVAAGAGLGLLAALHVRPGAAPRAAAASGVRGTAGRRTRVLRGLMVGSQVAVVFALLVCTGLMLRSLDRLLSEERGFDGDRVLALVEPEPLESRYPDARAREGLFRRALDRLEAVPGVTAAAMAAPLPFSGSRVTVSFRLADWPEPLEVGFTEASGRYFETMGIRVLRGRGFTSEEEGPDATVAVVNESLARRMSADGQAVGSTLPLGPDGSAIEVVGVVADVRHEGLGRPPGPRAYVPYSGDPDESLSLVIRTAGPAARWTSEVRAALHEVEPTLLAHGVAPLDRLVAGTVAFPRFRAALLAALATAAGLLAAVGIYGLTAFSVAERTREIGIRIALGARAPRLVAAAMGHELRMVGLGLAGGLIAALGLARALRGFLYGVGPADPAIFVATALLIVAVAAIASLLPAARAVRSDAVEALRVE